MQGAIRNISSVKQWFFDVGEPLFTLSYAGTSNQAIMRNTVKTDLNEAWDMLERQLQYQAESGRAMMQVITYRKESGANNPTGRTFIDLQPGPPQAQFAGIGQLPSGYMDEAKVQGLIREAKEKWEMERRIEDLEEQAKNPADPTDKIIQAIERIGATPIGQMFAARLLGMPVPAITGTPEAPADGDSDSDTFEDDIAATADILGVSDATLAARLRRLVEAQPDVAKQLLTAQ